MFKVYCSTLKNEIVGFELIKKTKLEFNLRRVMTKESVMSSRKFQKVRTLNVWRRFICNKNIERGEIQFQNLISPNRMQLSSQLPNPHVFIITFGLLARNLFNFNSTISDSRQTHIFSFPFYANVANLHEYFLQFRKSNISN